MVALTVYGGAGMVGGNQVLVEDGEDRLFLDFGTPYATRNLYYEEYLKPRPGTGLLDLLTLGLLPPLEGLYRRDLEPFQGLWERFKERPGYRRLEGVTGVVVSHAHLDHCGYVSFLRPDVRVYASLITSVIAKALQDTSPTDFEKELAYFGSRTAKEGGYLGIEGPRSQRPFTFLLTQNDSVAPPGEPVAPHAEALAFWDAVPLGPRTRVQRVAPDVLPQYGSIPGFRLRHFPVDHSILGATAFAVETSAGWIVYTGDIRRHGSQQGLVREFLEAAQALHPVALVCEGTRTKPAERRVTEEEVLEHCLQAVRGEEGLVIADFGPRNIERLVTFYQVAEASGRALVVTTKDAYLLDAMRHAWHQMPSLSEMDGLLIYDELRARDSTWEKTVREKYRRLFVGSKEIKASPGDYLLCFSFWDIDNLVDIEPQGGLYIYSASEVYDEEQGYDIDRLRHWLDRFGLRSLGLPRRRGDGGWEISPGEEGFHASGHAPAEDLLEVVKEIRPRLLVPVHTQNPGFYVENLSKEPIQVREPRWGVGLSLP
ncbi:MAG: exonuclease [Chloroflexi bacterium]|nr:exonuclease [Chloroflexota bacterium]